jgi:transcription elongation factor Elf1
MHSRFLLDSSVLSVTCPHCGHAETDDYEVLESDSLHRMHCAECEDHFHFAVMECISCGAECLFTWMQEPARAAIDDLVCPECKRSYVEHEVPSIGAGLFA